MNMDLYYTIVSFIFGITLGSFYNVVGYRLPRGESLIYPSSHCTKCNHKLGASELVPIFSYLFLRGKCKNCGEKISPFYAIFEFATGALFALSYHIFGYSIPFFIAITFISMLLIIIISDYQTMIIPDEVLILGSILILFFKFFDGGLNGLIDSIINGCIAFTIMFLLKKLGDFLFKKESMGGGDIKLLFTFGITLGFEMSILSIFLASFIALPFAVYFSFKYKDKKYIEDDEIPTHSIPFGPFLAIAAIVLLLLNMDFNFLINIFY